MFQINQVKQVTFQNKVYHDASPKTNPPSLNITILISYWLCLVCTLSMLLGFFGLIMTISPKLYFIWMIPINAHIIAKIRVQGSRIIGYLDSKNILAFINCLSSSSYIIRISNYIEQCINYIIIDSLTYFINLCFIQTQ